MRICILFCIATVTITALQQQQKVIPQKVKVPEAKKGDVSQQQVVIRQKQTKNQHQNVFKSIAHTHPGRNHFTIEVGTSDCRKAGSNAQFTFWFTGGHVAEGILNFNRNSTVLGPFVFNSMKRTQLDNVRSVRFGGSFASIEQTMSLMIIKKTRTSAVRAFADDWKPEIVKAHWSNSRDAHTEYFVFNRHCSSDWLVDNDYYVANHKGLISQIKDSEYLDITDILSLPYRVY